MNLSLSIYIYIERERDTHMYARGLTPAASPQGARLPGMAPERRGLAPKRLRICCCLLVMLFSWCTYACCLFY